MDGDSMDTVTEAIRRLQGEGYTGNWFATAAHELESSESGEVFDPTEVEIDHILRFEGESDPGDESIVFALRTPAGDRGIYSAPYGANTPTDDAAVIGLLQHRTGDGTLDG
jgi:hypothetical protein